MNVEKKVYLTWNTNGLDKFKVFVSWVKEFE
jgi:hypothetical protein